MQSFIVEKIEFDFKDSFGTITEPKQFVTYKKLTGGVDSYSI